MKNTIIIVLFSMLFGSCQQKVKPEALSNINGYWEIEKVVLESGEEKEYGINESYDYFEIIDKVGFRKKVMPQLDGTFLVNDTQEAVKVRVVDGQVFFDYATSYAKWSEELIAISEEKLVFKNEQNNIYYYKKATPLNLQGDGKKTE